MTQVTCWPFSKHLAKLHHSKPNCCCLVVVGDKGSGKTSLIFRFSRGRMPSAEEELESVLETDQMEVVRNGKTISLTVLDTSGDEDYARVRALAYSQAHCVIVCLPLDSPDALQRVETDWAPEIHYLCEGKPFVLAGTKMDLKDSLRERSTPKGKLYVSKRQGRKLAKKIGALAYLECSALDSSGDGKNVKRVFGRALRAGRRAQ